MQHTLEPLPYAYDALAPVISERTLRIHHDRHHRGYVDRLNQLIEATPFVHIDLESLVIQSESASRHRAVFNNAAQAWNHDFCWRSLSPHAGDQPPAPLAARLAQRFGSLAGFRSEFRSAAVEHFASGWAWLLLTPQGELTVTATGDADNPLLWGGYPLLCCDLWEHAYYLDYQQDRARYISAVVDRLLNWTFAGARLKAVTDRHAA